MKNIMILGGLQEFVPLVTLAREKNIRTVVVDGNIGAPAKELADAAYDKDIRDIEACAGIAKKEHVDAITTGYSDILLECMVKIAAAAGLPCHLRVEQLPYYRNKAVMHKTCAKLGIPMAKSCLLREGFDEKDFEMFRFPAVLKPLNLYGSRGLTVVRDIPAIRESLAGTGSLSRIPEVLCEEYNPDHEFNIQCWVRHGKIHILGIADREKTKFDVSSLPLSTRNVYPSRLINSVYQEAGGQLARYIRFTGQTEGPLCMQFFWGPERGFMAGEIAARFLGYEHELLHFSSGICIEDLLLSAAFEDGRVDRLLAGCDPFGKKSARGRKNAAVLYLHGRDGVIARQDSLRAACRRPDIAFGQLFYPDGSRIGSPQTMPYVARFDIVADSRADIDARTADILASLTVTDSDGRELLLKGEPADYTLPL